MTVKMRYAIAAIIAELLCKPAGAVPVRIRVTDTAGAQGLAKVVLIIQSLAGKGEDWRDLSNENGLASADLVSGEYRVIATYPYGYWLTQVREFVVADRPAELELHLRGAVIDVTNPSETAIEIRVLDSNSHPAEGAEIWGRDPEAHFTHSVLADNQGRASLLIPMDGAEVAVIYRGQVHVETFDIDSHVRDCPGDPCVVARIRETKRVLRKLIVRLP